MLNSLASTVSAIMLGMPIGYLLRAKTLPILRDYDFLIIGFSLPFTLIILANFQQVFREHDSIIRLLIDKNQIEDIKNNFQRFYKINAVET